MSVSTASSSQDKASASQPQTDENDDVLNEALLRWVNWHFESHNLPPISDLIEGTKDGKALLQLVECLSGQPLTPERGLTRIHFVGNVNKLLDFLRLQSTLKLSTIVPEDVIDGNIKIILSLVWNIALYYQIIRVLVLDGLVTRDCQLSSCEQAILSWSQQCTDNYSTVDITNLTSSWRDGLALNAVLHSHLSATFDFSRVLRMAPVERVANASDLASRHLGIPPIFAPEAVVNSGIDKKTLLLYLSMLFERLPRLPSSGGLIHRSESHSPTDIQSSGYEKTSMTSSMTDNDGGTNTSGGLGSSMGGPVTTFAESLENMLSWLAVAEGQLTLAESEQLGDGTPALAEQLSQHEELMGDMAKQQTLVGQLLVDGASQPAAAVGGEEQHGEVDQGQISLLRQRWEDLRTRVIRRLGAIQNRLTVIRRSDLDRIAHALPQVEQAVRDQLDSANGRNVLAVVNSLEGLNTHVNLIHNFEASVEGYLRTIEAVHANLIACEETPEFGEDGDQLLKKAVSFGERLAALQRQLEQQRDIVDRALRAWRFFAEEEGLFNGWLAEKEALMERMIMTKLSTSGTGGQSGSGSGSGSGSPSPFAQTVIRQVRLLKSIELEMDSQVRRFDSLNDHAQLVVSSLGGNTAVLATVSTQLEAMQQRWEALVLAMETHSQTLAATGVDLSEALLPSPSDSQEMQRSVGGAGSSGGSSTGVGVLAAITAGGPSGGKVSPASSCLSEFEFAARQLIDWLERAESGVGLMAVGDTRQPMSTEEQLALLAEMRTEMTGQSSQLEVVKQLGGRLVTDLEQSGEPGTDVTEAVRSLESRLGRLSRTVVASEKRLLVSVDLNVIQEEVSSLNEVLSGYEKFLKSLGKEQSAGRFSDPGMTSCLIDQCRVKLKLMSSYGDRIESLEHRSSSLQAPEDSMLEEVNNLHQAIDKFVGTWNGVRAQIDDKLKLLKKLAAQRPPKSVVESISALSRWLAEVEGVLQAEQIEANDVTVLTDKLNQLRELGTAVREYEDYLAKVEAGVKTSAASAVPGSTEQANLQASVARLVEQYKTVRETVESHSTNLQHLINDLSELQSNCDGLSTWLDEMRSFINETRPAVGDPETLKQQVNEWNDAERDVNTLEQTLTVIQSLTNSLLASANSKTFADKLVKQLSSLQSRFTDTAGETKSFGTKLKDSLETVEQLWKSVEALTTWLEERIKTCESERSAAAAASATSTEEGGGDNSSSLPKEPIEDETQLQERLGQAEKSRQEFDEKSAEYAALQQTYDGLVPSGSSTTDTPLNRQLQRLNAAWDRLSGILAEQLAVLQRAQTELQSVRDLAKKEGKWLDEIEQRLQLCRRPLTDAEDISEQSYELENIWQRDAAAHCSTEFRAISDRLVAAKICTSAVSAIREEADKRRDAVGERVTQELARLESMLQQSQEIERTLLGVMQWLCDADELLQSRLEADILAGDVPQEFEALQNEFTEHERVVAKLEAVKENLTEEKRDLAAARLKQQLDLIHERYATVNHKFAKFQRPADFDTKLERIRHALSEVEERLNLLEIREADIDTLSSQLDHCLRFYRTLSEVKPEVEYILRTGRQVVERRQVDYPEKLSASLDAIKHRFNAQGSQVTQSKGMLERAAKLAKKLTKDANVLRDLFTKIDAGIADVQQNDDTSGSPAMSVDDGIRLLEVLEGQLRRRQQTLRSAEDCMTQLTELANVCCGGGDTAQAAMREWLTGRHGSLANRMELAGSALSDALGKLRETQRKIQGIQSQIQASLESIGSALFRAEAQLRRWTTTGELSSSERQKLQTLQSELESSVAGSLFSGVRSLASQLGDIEPRLYNTVDSQIADFSAKLNDVQSRIQMALVSTEQVAGDASEGRSSSTPLSASKDAIDAPASIDDVISSLKSCLDKVQSLHQPDLSIALSADTANQLVNAYSTEFEATDEAVRACIARIGVWLEETAEGEDAESVAVMLDDLKKQAQTLVDHHASVTRLSRGVCDLREMELLRDQLSEKLAHVFDASDGTSPIGSLAASVTQEELDVIQTEAGDLQTVLNRVTASGFQPDSTAVRLLRRCDDLLSISTSGLLLQSQQSVSTTGAKDDSMFLSALSVQTSRSIAYDTPRGGSIDVLGDSAMLSLSTSDGTTFNANVGEAIQRITTIERSLAKADHVATVVLLENEFTGTCNSLVQSLESQSDDVIAHCTESSDPIQQAAADKIRVSVESLRRQVSKLKHAFEERKSDIQLVDSIEDRFEATRRDIDAIFSRQKSKPPLFSNGSSLFGLALYGLDAELSACLSECNLSESSSQDSPLASRALRLRNHIQANIDRLRSVPDAPRSLVKDDVDKCLIEAGEIGDNEWYAIVELSLKWAQKSPIDADEVQLLQEAKLSLADERSAFAKQVSTWIDRVLPEVSQSDVIAVDIGSLLAEIERKRRRLSIIEDAARQEELQERLNDLRQTVVKSAGHDLLRWLVVIQELVQTGRVRIGDSQQVTDELEKLDNLAADFTAKQSILKQIVEDTSTDEISIQMNDLKKGWDAAVVAVEERKTQLTEILTLSNDINDKSNQLDKLTDHLLESTSEAKAKVLESSNGILTPPSSVRPTESSAAESPTPRPPDPTVSITAASTPPSMPSPTTEGPQAAATEVEASSESVEFAAALADTLTTKGSETEELAKTTGDDPSIVRDSIDKSLRKFGVLVNRRLSLASIASSIGKKSVDDQLKDASDWLSAAESRLSSIEKSFDQQLTAISSSSIVPAEELNQQFEELQRELTSQICRMEALQRQHADLTAVHAFRDRMNRLQNSSKVLGEKLADPTWQRIAAALKLHTTWATTTQNTIVGDFHQLPSSSEQLARLRSRLQELRREIESRRPVVDRLISNGHSVLISADSVAVNDLGKCLRNSREKWDQLLGSATRAEQRLTTATPLINELETCTRLATEKLERAEQSATSWVAPGDLPIDALDAELERVRSLELALLPIQSRLDCLEQLCDRLNQIEAPLVDTARLFFDELRSRWRSLHSATAQRHAELHRLLTEFGPHHFLAASVEAPWERALTQPGRIPYYVNHQTETTSWDHPVMTTLVDSFRELNNIRFAAYRTGQKLRAVQKATCLDQVPLLDFARCCDKLGFPTGSHTIFNGNNNGTMGRALSPPIGDVSSAPTIDILDMVTCLSQVFESAAEQVMSALPMNVPLCVDLTLNWLLNCYDPARTGKIRLAAFKAGVALLAGGTLEEKYRYLFRVAADSSGRCDARRLALLIHDALQLPRHLGEVAAFGGTNVEPSVRSCLALAEQELDSARKKSPTSPRPTSRANNTMTTSEISNSNNADSTAGQQTMATSMIGGTVDTQSLRITVDTFLEWLQLEPQSFVWLPVLYRLALSETAEHPGVRCAICKSHRLIGLRYRCLRCFSFDICQSCFFSGRVAKSHKLTHPIQEYCSTTTSSEEVRDLTTVFCNQFKPRSYFKKHRRFGYLPVQTVYEGTPIEGPAPSSVARHSHPPPRLFDEFNDNFGGPQSNTTATDNTNNKSYHTNEVSFTIIEPKSQNQQQQQVVPDGSGSQEQRESLNESEPLKVIEEQTCTRYEERLVEQPMPVASSTVGDSSVKPEESSSKQPHRTVVSSTVESDQQVYSSAEEDEHLLIARYARVLESGGDTAAAYRRSSGGAANGAVVMSSNAMVSSSYEPQRRSSRPNDGDVMSSSTEAVSMMESPNTSQTTVVTVVRHQQQQQQQLQQQRSDPRSPMQVLASMEANRMRDDVECRIKQLESESARLQSEYSRLLNQQRQVSNGHAPVGLRHSTPCGPVSNGSAHPHEDSFGNKLHETPVGVDGQKAPLSEAEMASEARLLRHHRDRLELRLRILEEHNGQLENQLTRLRLLLADQNQRSQPHVVPSPPGTTSMVIDQRTPPHLHQQQQQNNANNYLASGYRRTGAAANMTELLQMADSIGQAVGTLVNVYTDSESDGVGPTTTA